MLYRIPYPVLCNIHNTYIQYAMSLIWQRELKYEHDHYDMYVSDIYLMDMLLSSLRTATSPDAVQFTLPSI